VKDFQRGVKEMGFYTSKVGGNRYLKGDYHVHGVPNVRNSTYVFQLTSSSGAVVCVGAGSTPSATRKKLKIAIDGVDYYLLASTGWTL
jgi:hypothetical protein